MNYRNGRKNYIQGILKHSTNGTRVQQLDEEYHTTSDCDKSEGSYYTCIANMYANADTAPCIVEKSVYNGVNDDHFTNVHVFTTSAALTQNLHTKEEYAKNNSLETKKTLKGILKKSPSIGQKLYKSFRKITPNYRKNRGIESTVNKRNFSHISLHSNKQSLAEGKNHCSFSPIHVNEYNIPADAYEHSTEKGKYRENLSEDSIYRRTLHDNEYGTNKGLQGILKNELIQHLNRIDVPNTLRKSKIDGMKNCKSDVTHNHNNLRNQNTHMYNRTKECKSIESISPRYKQKLRLHRVEISPQNHQRRERSCNEYGQFNMCKYAQHSKEEENQANNTSNATLNGFQSRKKMRAGPTLSKQSSHAFISMIHIESDESSSGVEDGTLSKETRNILSRRSNGELKSRKPNSGKSKSNAKPAVHKKQYIKEEKQSSSCSYSSDVENIEQDEIECMSETKNVSSSSVPTSVEGDELKTAHTRNVENPLHERKSTQIPDSKSHRKSRSSVRSKSRNRDSENTVICARSRASENQSVGQVSRHNSNMNVRSYNSLKELERYLTAKKKQRKRRKSKLSDVHTVYSRTDRKNATEIENGDRCNRVRKRTKKDLTSSSEKIDLEESSSDEITSLNYTSSLDNNRGLVEVFARKRTQSKQGQVKSGDNTAFSKRRSRKSSKDRRTRAPNVIASDDLECESRLNKNKVKLKKSSDKNVSRINDTECKQSSTTSSSCIPIHQCINANMHNSFKSSNRIPTSSSTSFKIGRKNSRLMSYEKMNTLRSPEQYDKSKNNILLGDIISARKLTRPIVMQMQNTPKLRQQSSSQPPVSELTRSRQISAPRNMFSQSSQRIDTKCGASDREKRPGSKHISNYRQNVSLRGKAPEYSSSDSKLITKQNTCCRNRSTNVHPRKTIDLRFSALRDQKSQTRSRNGGDSRSVDLPSVINNSTVSTTIDSSNDSRKIPKQCSFVKNSSNLHYNSGLKPQFSSGITPAVNNSEEPTVISNTDLELSERTGNGQIWQKPNGHAGKKCLSTFNDQASCSCERKQTRNTKTARNVDKQGHSHAGRNAVSNRDKNATDLKQSRKSRPSNDMTCTKGTKTRYGDIDRTYSQSCCAYEVTKCVDADGNTSFQTKEKDISLNYINNKCIKPAILSKGILPRNVSVGCVSGITPAVKKSKEPTVILNTDLELSKRTGNGQRWQKRHSQVGKKNVHTFNDQASYERKQTKNTKTTIDVDKTGYSHAGRYVISNSDKNATDLKQTGKSRPSNDMTCTKGTLVRHGDIDRTYLQSDCSYVVTQCINADGNTSFQAKEKDISLHYKYNECKKPQMLSEGVMTRDVRVGSDNNLNVTCENLLDLSERTENDQRWQRRHGTVVKKHLHTFNDQASYERKQTRNAKTTIDTDKREYSHAGRNVVSDRNKNATDLKQSLKLRPSNGMTCTKGTLVRQGDIDRTYSQRSCAYVVTKCVDAHGNTLFKTNGKDISLNYINKKCIKPQFFSDGIMRDVSDGSDHNLNDTCENLRVEKTSSVRRDLNGPCSQSYGLIIDAFECRARSLAQLQVITKGDSTSEVDLKAFNESRDHLTQFMLLAAEKARLKAYPFASKYVQNAPDSNIQGKSGIQILQEALERQLAMCREIARNHRTLMGPTSSRKVAQSCSVYPQRFNSAILPKPDVNNDKEENCKEVQEYVKGKLNVDTELSQEENCVHKEINQHSGTLGKSSLSLRKCLSVDDLMKYMPVNDHSKDGISVEVCERCRINKESYICGNTGTNVFPRDMLLNLNGTASNSHAKGDKCMGHGNDKRNSNNSYIRAKSVSKPKEKHRSFLKNQSQLSSIRGTCYLCNVGLTENTKPRSSVEGAKMEKSSTTDSSHSSYSKPHNTNNLRSWHSLKSKSDSKLVISSRYAQKSHSRIKAQLLKRSMQSSSIYAMKQKFPVPWCSVFKKGEELVDSNIVGMELKSQKKYYNVHQIRDKEMTYCSNCRFCSDTAHTLVKPERASTCRPLFHPTHTIVMPDHENVKNSIQNTQEMRKNEIRVLHQKECIPKYKDRLLGTLMKPCNRYHTNNKLNLEQKESKLVANPSVCYCNDLSKDCNKLAKDKMLENEVIILQNESGHYSVYTSAKAEDDSSAKNTLRNNNNSNTPIANSRQHILKRTNKKSYINEESMSTMPLRSSQPLNNKKLRNNSIQKVSEMRSTRDHEIRMNKDHQGTLPQSSKRTIDGMLRNAWNACRHIDSRTLPMQENYSKDRTWIEKNNRRKVSFFEPRPLIKKSLNTIQVRDNEKTNHNKNISRDHRQSNQGMFCNNEDSRFSLLRRKQVLQTWPSYSSHKITK